MTLLDAVDALLALVVLEAVVLWLYHARTGRGLAPRRLLPTLLAGFGLLLAFRLALGGAGAVWAAGALALAGSAHVLDLKGRWRARD